MSDLTYDNLIERLLMAVPEIRAEHEENLEWLGDDYLPHVVFGIEFNPYLTESLIAKPDDDLLSRAFAFLEEMAHSQDERVLGVLMATVCEHISGQGLAVGERARSFMSPETKRICHHAAIERGHSWSDDEHQHQSE